MAKEKESATVASDYAKHKIVMVVRIGDRRIAVKVQRQEHPSSEYRVMDETAVEGFQFPETHCHLRCSRDSGWVSYEEAVDLFRQWVHELIP